MPGGVALPEQQGKYGRYALVLLIMGALCRLLLMALLRHIPIVIYTDMSYIQTAQDILRLNFRALGDRVPVYPLFVAFCGLNPRVVWVAQSVLGVIASLMIFDIAFRRTRHGIFSLLVGVTCSLIPEFLLYESTIATEVLSNFLLVTSVWFVTRCDGTEVNNFRYPLGLGLIVTLAGLTRPLMLCLVPVYYFLLIPLWPLAKILKRQLIRRTLIFALPVIVFVLGWCGFNYFNNGLFTPTTRAGQQLMNQVDPYVYLAPDRFAMLRDIWVQSRQVHPPPHNASADETYGETLAEMERRTGKTEFQVAHEAASLAIYLQIHHPLLCLRRAELGCMQFWGDPSPEESEWRQGGKARLTEFVMAMANFLVREVKAAFLLLALLSVPCALFRLKAFTKVEYLIFAIALWVSAFAAFTEFGDNRRFCVPLYMLIIYTVMTRVWMWIAATPSECPDPIPD